MKAVYGHIQLEAGKNWRRNHCTYILHQVCTNLDGKYC